MSELSPILSSGGDAQAIIDAARLTASPVALTPDEPQGFVVPPGHQVVVPDLSAWRQSPSRKTGVYKPATVEALIAYAKRYAISRETVWVHPTSGRVQIVLDDDHDDGPGFAQHRADLRLEHTPEWNYWLAKHGREMGQEAFAEHIEEGGQEIVEPDAATVLEIAQTFHMTTKVTFRQATRLTSGAVQFQYDNEGTAKAGAKGDLTIPTVIMLQLAPFIGEPEQRLVARLRYRVREGALTLSYHLDRPDRVIRDALDGVAGQLAGAFPNVYLGEPKP